MIKVKKSVYKLKLFDIDVTILNSFIFESLLNIKSSILETVDEVVLEQLLVQKYCFYNIAKQLGFNEYNKELASRPSLKNEISSIIDKNTIKLKRDNVVNTSDTSDSKNDSVETSTEVL